MSNDTSGYPPVFKCQMYTGPLKHTCGPAVAVHPAFGMLCFECADTEDYLDITE